MPISKTIVISCAGIGSRLGLGYTKALVKVAGRPLIYHHLAQLKEYEDVRVVVGYSARELIKTVLEYRKNVTFVYNHNFLNTNEMTSLYLGSRHSHDLVVSLDGDLLVKPSDLRDFLHEEGEVLGYIKTYSDNPVCVELKKRNNQDYISRFIHLTKPWQKRRPYEWCGLAQMSKSKIVRATGHVYQSLQSYLPLRAIKVDCREIDTASDYQQTLKWAKKIFTA